MKQQSRKLLSRLGAALLLGLSMFNFGAAWNKMRGGEIPRKTRNIRKRTQEELDQDVKEIAQVAEEEAQIVLASQQLREEESQQQLQSETMSITQKTVRYAAVSVWVVSAGLIFSSAIFNYPFALGKGMLSLLPGIPHMASLKAETLGNYFEVGQEVPVGIILDSGDENVKSASVSLEYDPQKVEFERFEVNREIFDISKDFLSEVDKGAVSVVLENSARDVIANKEKIATFIFSVKQEGLSEVSIDQSGSLVMKKTRSGEFANILGKVGDVQLRLIAAKEHGLLCYKLVGHENDSEEDVWEKVAQGNILPSEKPTWNEINDEWGFACSYDRASGNIFFLVSGPQDNLSNIQLAIDEDKAANMNFGISKKWQEGERYFFGAILEGGDMQQVSSLGEVGLEVELQGQNLKWPDKGKANLVLQ